MEDFQIEPGLTVWVAIANGSPPGSGCRPPIPEKQSQLEKNFWTLHFHYF